MERGGGVARGTHAATLDSVVKGFGGSPLLCLCFAVAVALGSCDTQGRTRRTPSKPIPEVEVEPVDPTVELGKGDTVVVAEPTPEVPDSTVVPDIPASDVAQVAMLLPFFSDGFSPTTTDLPDNADWAIQYFAGAKLALYDLEAAGERAVVHVFDSEGDAATAQRLVQEPDVRRTQAIVAPYLTEAVRAAATPARAMGMPFIVPYSAAANLTRGDYPELLQINPGLPTHLDALAAYLTSAYAPEQITLLGLPNGQQDKLVAYLMKRHRELDPTQGAWKTWRLHTSEPGMTGLDWTNRFSGSGPHVFVFPIYNDPLLINGFMSQLQIARGRNEVELVGLPQWTEMSELDPNSLESLGAAVTVGPRIDYDDPDVIAFTDRYVDAYRVLPELPALLGYDALAYAVPLINEHGIEWTEHLPTSFDGLASDYRLQPKYGAGSTEGKPARYENTDVDVLRFRNFRWGSEER